MSSKFRDTVKLIQQMFKVGPRQSARFVLALMEKDESELKTLGYALSNLKKEIKVCNVCFNLSTGSLCEICSNNKRDKTKLMVLEKVTDLDSIEKTGLYKGLYHVLGGAIDPLEKISPETLNFRQLEARVSDLSRDKSLELIIATNPTTNGETTALYIKNIFENSKRLILTRLGRGLSSGSSLEFTDEITLRNALEHRK